MTRPISKKRAIEAAAIKLFARKGLAATTLKDIAREAGATEGALYRHYQSKDDMAWQLFSEELKAFAELLSPLLESSQPFPVRLAAAIRFIYDYFRGQPDVFAFILLTQHNFPGQKLLDEFTNPNDMAIRFMRRAMEEGAVAAGDPVLQSALIMGAVLQPLVMQRYGRLVVCETMVEEVVTACLRLTGAA